MPHMLVAVQRLRASIILSSITRLIWYRYMYIYIYYLSSFVCQYLGEMMLTMPLLLRLLFRYRHTSRTRFRMPPAWHSDADRSCCHCCCNICEMSCIHYTCHTSATSAARTTPHCLLYSPIVFTEFHWTSPSRYCREHGSPATHRVGSRQVGTCWDPCRITTCWCHDIYHYRHYISLFDIDPRCDLAWEDCVDPLPLPIGASTCGDRLFPVAHARDAMRLMRSKIQHSKS